MRSISASQLAERLKSHNPPHLLDVREPEEHALVALPNSTLIPLGELASRAEEIENWKDDDVVVYCHHGVRSVHAIGIRGQFGFTRLHNLSGGIDRWTEEADPTLPRY